jgi:predicted DNA-binding transcriptional regulator AlpA
MPEVRPEVTGRKTGTLLRKTAVAARLGVSVWTVDQYVRKHLLPSPLYLTDGSPGMWRSEWVDALIDRAHRRRRNKPARGGTLKQYQD